MGELRGITERRESRSRGIWPPCPRRVVSLPDDYTVATVNPGPVLPAFTHDCTRWLPDGLPMIRILLVELQRISSHLVSLGTHALEVGAVSVLMYCLSDRERILKSEFRANALEPHQ